MYPGAAPHCPVWQRLLRLDRSAEHTVPQSAGARDGLVGSRAVPTKRSLTEGAEWDPQMDPTHWELRPSHHSSSHESAEGSPLGSSLGGAGEPRCWGESPHSAEAKASHA